MPVGSAGVVPRPAAGSVHASRNPPRAPAASLRDRLRRALTEVDPIWLAQSNDPAAVALRQARQDGKRPAAWRVLHRVTYVSRVLAPADTTQQPLEQALATLNISSNYELIRTLEPFVRGRTGQYADFVAAVRNAVTTYLPDLLPHIDDIVAFVVLYYGVSDAPQLANGQLPAWCGTVRPGRRTAACRLLPHPLI